MYAIIKDGGHQYRVEQGQRLRIHFREVAENSQVTFDQVCLVAGDGATRVGTPFVAGATVEAKVVSPLVKGVKLNPSFYRVRKHSRKRTGHRQHYTEIEITGIAG